MADQYRVYFEILEKWNEKMNLMSISGYEEFISKHVEDSKKALSLLRSAKSVLDLGSGAGIPGLVIKIERPKIETVLVEATRKKVSFQQEVIRRLGLKGIDAVWGRAEDEGLMRGLGAFDAVISRATWSLDEYLRISTNYMSSEGRIIAMKGPKWPEELKKANNIIDEAELRLDASEEYTLEGGESRAILVFKRS